MLDLYALTLFQTAYDIHCWVGKQASSKIYKRALYSAIALDDAVINQSNNNPVYLSLKPLMNPEADLSGTRPIKLILIN